jgi:hypothetical protein
VRLAGEAIRGLFIAAGFVMAIALIARYWL